MGTNKQSSKLINNNVIFWTLLILIAGLPLIIIPSLYDLFDLPKATLLRLVALTIFTIWILKIIYLERLEWRRTPLDLPLLVFLFLALLTTVFSINPLISTVGTSFERHEALFTWFSYGILFFAASNFLDNWEHILRLLKLLIGVSAIVSLYGIIQHFGYDFFPFKITEIDKPRSIATFGNPVFLGSYLTFMLPISISLLIMSNPMNRATTGRASSPTTSSTSDIRHQTSNSILWAISTILIIIALIFTYARGAWLGAFVGLLAWIFLYWRVGKKSPPSPHPSPPRGEEINPQHRPTSDVPGRESTAERRAGRRPTLLLILLILIILIASITIFISEKPLPGGISIRERISSAFEVKGSFAARLSIWRTTIPLIMKRPIWGWGLETLKDVFPAHREAIFVRLEGPGRIADRPHNQLLYIAFSMGLVGLFAYLWIIVTFLWTVAGNLKVPAARLRTGTSPVPTAHQPTNEPINQLTNQRHLTSDIRHPTLLVGLFSASLGYLVQEQFAFSLVGVTPLFWILMGITMNLVSTKPVTSKRDFRLSINSRRFLSILLLLVVIFLLSFILRFVIADYKFYQGLREDGFGQYERANNSYAQAISYNPWGNRYRLAFGENCKYLALRTHNPLWLQRAIASYQKGLQVNPLDFDLYFGAGNVYFVSSLLQSSNDYSLAKNTYFKAIELEPYFVEAHTWLGKAYLREKSYDNALEHLNKVLKFVPQSPAVLETLREVYQAKGAQKGK